MTYRSHRRTAIAATALGALACSSAGAQQPTTRPAAAASTISSEVLTSRPERLAVVRRIIDRLEQSYIEPAVGKKACDALRQRLSEGAYDANTSGEALAKLLTSLLQDITHDKHLAITYSPTVLPEMPPATWQDPPQGVMAARNEWMRKRNYGFQRVEVLDGNVGYMSIIGFAPCQSGWDTVVATMAFLAETDALIIDLRDNEGGSPEMVSMICSYLFDCGFQAVHLNDVYTRDDGEIHQFWTLPYVPGKRYANKDVYVLTSAKTFSSGEELAYDLQVLRRATIVGEVTVGGAHLGSTERLSDHFAMFVPSGRSVNPTTGTNWEGVGVMPDLAATRELALPVAHLAALRKLAANATADEAKRRLATALDAASRALDARRKAAGL